MTREPIAWIFGYGSLAGWPATATRLQRRPARLRGHRRCWEVAMDNSKRIPGYKVFVDPRSGEQPPVFVTFLDMQRDEDAWINGVLIPVPEAELSALDARERNYDRHEVTPYVDAEIDGAVWAYIGSDHGRERYRTGRDQGTAVVSTEYLAAVEQGFAELGARALELFRSTTSSPEVPLVPLRRVDL